MDAAVDAPAHARRYGRWLLAFALVVILPLLVWRCSADAKYWRRAWSQGTLFPEDTQVIFLREQD